MPNARWAKNNAAKDAKFVAYSAVSSGVTARETIPFREAFHGPARVLLLPPKRHCQRRSTRDEAAEKRNVLIANLTSP